MGVIRRLRQVGKPRLSARVSPRTSSSRLASGPTGRRTGAARASNFSCILKYRNFSTPPLYEHHPIYQASLPRLAGSHGLADLADGSHPYKVCAIIFSKVWLRKNKREVSRFSESAVMAARESVQLLTRTGKNVCGST